MSEEFEEAYRLLRETEDDAYDRALADRIEALWEAAPDGDAPEWGDLWSALIVAGALDDEVPDAEPAADDTPTA